MVITISIMIDRARKGSVTGWKVTKLRVQEVVGAGEKRKVLRRNGTNIYWRPSMCWSPCWLFTYMILLALHRNLVRHMFLSSSLSGGSEKLSNLSKVPQPGISASGPQSGPQSGLSDCKVHCFHFCFSLSRTFWTEELSEIFQSVITVFSEKLHIQPDRCNSANLLPLTGILRKI